MATAKKTSKKRIMPAALVKQAEAKKAEALARIKEQGEADVSLVVRKRAEIADAFYEIGEALKRLSRPGVAQALGFRGFEDLCETRLGISTTRAVKLISVVERVRREDAVHWGQEKTAALIEIANATPALDTPGMLRAERLKRPDGRPIDPEHDSVRDLEEAAKSLRERRDNKSRRGRTTSPDERKTAVRLERMLHEAGIEHPKVQAVATKPGQVSNVRIEVPFDRMGVLKTMLGKLGREA